MKTFSIIGERSKIGQSILNHLKNNPSLPWKYVQIRQNPDYLFLATSSEESKQYFKKFNNSFKIVDFSNSFKNEAFLKKGLFTYGYVPLLDNYYPNIAFPGCSTLACLMALDPLKNDIIKDSVFIDTKFSKSAMQRKSNLVDISINEAKIESINSFKHYHQNELNQALNYELDVKIIPSIVDIKNGLFINVFFNLKNKLNVFELLKNYYLNKKNIFVVEENYCLNNNFDILGTNNILLKINQHENRVGISIFTDNLINGKIFDLLDNHKYNDDRLNSPLDNLVTPAEDGDFASVRKYDIHTGIDLHCSENSNVYSMEDGIVIKNEPFTGTIAGSSWWEDTNYVGIKGNSGYIIYGEISSSLKTGDLVKAGSLIGNVKRVLKKNKGKPQSMLHLEYYRKEIDDPFIWQLKDKDSVPENLLNPNLLLRKIKKIS